MAKDPFDKFMSNYSENTPSLNSVVNEAPPVRKEPEKKSSSKDEVKVTAEQRQALAEARNANRGRPVTGTVKAKKKRIGFEVDPELADNFKKISFRTGIPFGQLYEEAMSDLILKYNK